MPWTGVGSALVGAAASTVGGLFGRSKASGPSNWDLFNYQKELNQNQIQWRVEDAKKAGLHPLAALGISGLSMSAPQAVGSDSSSDTSWLGDAGQYVARAIQAGMSKEDRDKAKVYQETSNQLDLEGKQLQNKKTQAEIDAIASQAALSQQEVVRHAQQVPVPRVQESARLLDGQGDAPYKFAPLASLQTPFGNNLDALHLAPYHAKEGMEPSAYLVRNRNGTTSVVPNENAIGDLDFLADPVKYAEWQWSNRINPRNLGFFDRLIVEPVRETARFAKHYGLYPKWFDTVARAYKRYARGR